MKRTFSLLVILLLFPVFHVVSGTTYYPAFSGYVEVGNSLVVGSYTITLEDAGSGIEGSYAVIEVSNSTSSKVFRLSPGENATFGDTIVVLVDVKVNSEIPFMTSSGFSAFLKVYSKPIQVFYGVAYPGTEIKCNGKTLDVVNVTKNFVSLRYSSGNVIDYGTFAVGNYTWHSLRISVYEISNGSVLLRVSALPAAETSLLPGVYVEVQNVSIGNVSVGGTFNVTFFLKNVGKQPAYFVQVYVGSGKLVRTTVPSQLSFPLGSVVVPGIVEIVPFSVYEGSPVRYFNILLPGSSVKVSFKMIASKDLKPDVYPLKISLQYFTQAGTKKEEEYTVGVPVGNSLRPMVYVESFKTVPYPVPPGGSFTLDFVLKNTGKVTAYDVVVRVTPTKPKTTSSSSYSLLPTIQSSGEKGYAYPISSQGLLYIQSIKPGESTKEKIRFHMKNVEPGVYPLYIEISYLDGNGVSYTEESTIGIVVNAVPILRAYVGNIWVSDGKYHFEIDVANDGNVPARGVTLSVSSTSLKVFPLGERYLGTVEPMDYDSADYTVIQGTVKAGRYSLKIVISYLGTNRTVMMETQTVYLYIPSNLKRGGTHWYLPVAIVAIIILLWWKRHGRGAR